MFNSILAQLNWVDLLVGCILLRGLYIGIARGFFVESFKILGIVVAVFITQHYYFRLAVFLKGFVAIPTRAGELLSFLFLWLVVVTLFKLAREGVMLAMKREDPSGLSRVGGGFLAVTRTLLAGGLLVSSLFVSGLNPLIKAAKGSFSGLILLSWSENIYESSFDSFVSDFFPFEEKNEKILALGTQNIERKKR